MTYNSHVRVICYLGRGNAATRSATDKSWCAADTARSSASAALRAASADTIQRRKDFRNNRKSLSMINGRSVDRIHKGNSGARPIESVDLF
jgi:hypothetical protein